MCMGVLLATGFTVIGLKFGLVIGLALGVLNIVPYLGSILGFIGRDAAGVLPARRRLAAAWDWSSW
jgi:hypothetical protein